jgi:hypothetical protein
MSDDGFHEIQLSGKQLVFLFMATTVVSVVIFLCGVLVGRGVRADQAPLGALIGAGADTLGDVSPTSPDVRSVPGDAGALVDDAASLTYFRRLESDAPVEEDLLVAADDPPAIPEPLPVTEAPPEASASEGFTVQVAALRGRADAQTIRDQLTGKGYPAYVLDPAPDAPAAVYRVRVGRYQERAEAEDVRRRLETEEQFKPWITR